VGKWGGCWSYSSLRWPTPQASHRSHQKPQTPLLASVAINVSGEHGVHKEGEHRAPMEGKHGVPMKVSTDL
jgi:hypothetical protein